MNMKIIITNIPLKKELHAFEYCYEGKRSTKNREVIFPINAVLQDKLEKNDNVKVIMLAKQDVEGNSSINVEHFKSELNEINKNINAHIEYETLSTPFVETKDIYERLLRQIIGLIDNESELYADITYGPKALPIIMFTVLNFAEKYLNCDINYIAYGKVDYVDDGNNRGVSVPANPCLYDMRSIYYLNSITNSFNYKNSKDAIKALDSLLNLKK